MAAGDIIKLLPEEYAPALVVNVKDLSDPFMNLLNNQNLPGNDKNHPQSHHTSEHRMSDYNIDDPPIPDTPELKQSKS